MSKSQLQKVVLVGRMNVGKSTLFNRLANEGKSLALDYSGVTRDFIADKVDWKGKHFELIDSGGVMLKKPTGKFTKLVNEQVMQLINEAEIVVLVCDGSVGIHPEDRELVKILHKQKKFTIIVVNKIDTNLAKENQYEFEKLGLDKLITISAQHGTGTGDLLDEIAHRITDGGPVDIHTKFRVSLLGKPNVGKSSLMNLLLGKERTIVSELAGTTREAIKEDIRFYQEDLQLVDTAGVRRKRGINEKIETLMVKSTLAAVRESNIILLLIDSSEGVISDQELKLAFYVFEQGKALILLFNKQDLVDDEIEEEFVFNTSEYKFFLKKVEAVKISCKTGKNIGKIMPLVKEVWRRDTQEFSDVALTDLFKTAMFNRPLYRNRQKLVMRKARQIMTAPITINLYVTMPDFFKSSQLAFFENLLRSKYDLKGVPIKLIPRKG
jgi:GTP-binding protein